jgi:GAF domain-containing protein
VLGTFGTYYKDVRQPTPEEMAAVRDLAQMAARALDEARAA